MAQHAQVHPDEMYFGLATASLMGRHLALYDAVVVFDVFVPFGTH